MTYGIVPEDGGPGQVVHAARLKPCRFAGDDDAADEAALPGDAAAAEPEPVDPLLEEWDE